MKRIISGLLVLVMGLSVGIVSPKQTDASVFDMALRVYPSIKSIKLCVDKDKDTKKVAYYKFYRATCTRKYVNKHDEIPKKKYKFIKKTHKRKYVDKKTKKGKMYFYYVLGYNKKGKLIGKDVNRDCSYEYMIGKPGKPRVENAYIDDYRSSSKRLYIEVSSDPHKMKAASFIIYRKKEGEKKYKKVKTLKVSNSEKKEWFTSDVFKDTKVKARGIYYYKAKVMSKVGKKKYYSKFSKPIDSWAVNCDPDYKIECLTDAGEDVREAVFKIQNADKGNGPSILGRGYNYVYQATKNSKEYYLSYQFTEYSYDNVNWHTIPMTVNGKEIKYRGRSRMDYGGIELPTDKPLYIKMELSANGEEKLDKIPFGGKTAYKSYLDVYENIETCTSDFRFDGAEGIIDFVTGKGGVHFIGAD